ncbi:hypothetical protein H6G89_22355 [Oscillatoria sp. FACHB-1407]|uniref:hypothetical protein n=1 Tax=Oscillatoria sp. FACHB-1407 TaxID=2692847 RepID=UPI00168890B9|nr:hypothetical protein [Oscillatoria sp. FACHB-1407]MBD2463747.1 hypothetical protein [Oscillatoria sp. FACHB-1407]
MNVVSDTSDIHILESIAFKISSKPATVDGVRFVSEAYSLPTEQPIDQHQPIDAAQVSQVLPVCFVIVWAIAVFVFLRFKPHRHKQPMCTVRGQIPCTTCRFFTNNPYVKCAVRPDLALTKQAIDCTDYQD